MNKDEEWKVDNEGDDDDDHEEYEETDLVDDSEVLNDDIDECPKFSIIECKFYNNLLIYDLNFNKNGHKFMNDYVSTKIMIFVKEINNMKKINPEDYIFIKSDILYKNSIIVKNMKCIFDKKSFDRISNKKIIFKFNTAHNNGLFDGVCQDGGEHITSIITGK